MSFFADILASLFDRKLGLANRVEDDNKPIDALCQALLSSRGDVSGMSLAQLILDRYADLDDAGKLAWFSLWQMTWMFLPRRRLRQLRPIRTHHLPKAMKR